MADELSKYKQAMAQVRSDALSAGAFVRGKLIAYYNNLVTKFGLNEPLIQKGDKK